MELMERCPGFAAWASVLWFVTLELHPNLQPKQLLVELHPGLQPGKRFQGVDFMLAARRLLHETPSVCKPP